MIIMCILKDIVNVVFALGDVLKRVDVDISVAVSELADIAADLDNTNDERVTKVYDELMRTKKLIKGVLG